MARLSAFAAPCVCLLACGQMVSPSYGDVDFAVQGEYLGINAANSDTVGAQVVALGSGTFRLLLLPGGLPGRGWNGAKQILNGSLQGGAARFAQAGFNLSADTAGDSLRGTNAQGQSLRLGKILRKSPTLDSAPPAGAIRLFDGSTESLSQWTGARRDSDGSLLVSAAPGAVTTRAFGDFFLHLEFSLPFQPSSRGQGRGNSGLYVQNRYEIQILDSFGEDLAAPSSGFASEHCGAVFWQREPDVNMSFPPLSWQTYDIAFRAARFDGGNKVEPARITVRHNGVIIHDDWALTGSTALSGLQESSAPGPQFLQEHGNPVRFRNIWIVENGGASIRGTSPKGRQGRAAGLPRYALGVLTPDGAAFLPDGRTLAPRSRKQVDEPARPQ